MTTARSCSVSYGCPFDEDEFEDDEFEDECDEYGDAGLVALVVDSNGDPTEVRLVGGQEVLVRYSDIPDEDLTVVNGIPCTTALRTIIDIAPDLGRPDLEHVLDDCLRRGLFTLDEAVARVAEGDMRSRPGAVLLRELLADRT